MKAFIESQFGYFPLVWMFCGNNELTTSEELLGKHKLETMNQTNIKILAAELFKIKNKLSNDIMA